MARSQPDCVLLMNHWTMGGCSAIARIAPSAAGRIADRRPIIQPEHSETILNRNHSNGFELLILSIGDFCRLIAQPLNRKVTMIEDNSAINGATTPIGTRLLHVIDKAN